jgi:predicted aspartyl protease
MRFLVDSGAVYSVVPAAALRRLGIEPRSTRSFLLADGSDIKRKMAGALFTFRGEEGLSPVIFGEKGDATLLGTVSLEALGLVLDPLQRQLRPMPMVLARGGRRQ